MFSFLGHKLLLEELEYNISHLPASLECVPIICEIWVSFRACPVTSMFGGLFAFLLCQFTGSPFCHDCLTLCVGPYWSSSKPFPPSPAPNPASAPTNIRLFNPHFDLRKALLSATDSKGGAVELLNCSEWHREKNGSFVWEFKFICSFLALGCLRFSCILP